MSTTAPASSRQPPPFNTSSNDTARGASAKDEVESPSISAPHALARFEFESGRGNEGTKILMVEWEDEEQTRNKAGGEWHITWEGMRTVLPASEKENAKISDDVAAPGIGDSSGGRSASKNSSNNSKKTTTIAETGGTHRMYFLLQPGTPVPPIVTLTFRSTPQTSPTDTAADIVWHTNPLPAIFPPELGASARAAGKKGVLHTIWAKQRVRTLQAEIEEESRSNVESVGLTMIVQEKEWIEENFGVAARPSVGTLQTDSNNAPRSPGATSPRSPGGSRLQQKLQGLRLGTTDRELAISSRKESQAVGFNASEQNPLSPETGDVAVSSFAAIKGSRSTPFESLSSMAAKPPQQPQHARKMTPARPPEAILREQESMGMGSLGSFAGFRSMAPSAPSSGLDDDEDLFAMPISPRSPEMSKSPFTFALEDVQRQGQTVGGKGS